MPPFKLEEPERLPTHSRKPQIIYTKNLYSEGVKLTNWQDLLEPHPFDDDPLCQGKINHFVSHYKRLGCSDDYSFSTTTGDMLEQSHRKCPPRPDEHMGNYYTYNDNVHCMTELQQNGCPEICADEFLTTMQHSYRLPKPYVMQRLSFPKIPYMQNQKYRHEPPELSNEKFYDENFKYVTCQLQRHKRFRSVSYNPMTGEYTKP